jgi:cellulose synthase/poly-beta-1,6-N-acetylglucosamine synthase-like glycosyltransferase
LIYDKKFVSVIVCTYNRAALLERLLEVLTRQTLPHDEFEVIVVIDGSTDGSGNVCQKMADKLPNLRIITKTKNAGFSIAANDALKIAQGEYLAFTDDDCLPYPNWIESMRNALLSDDIVAGGIDSPAKNYLTLVANISEFHPFMKFGGFKQIGFIAGANMGFRREILLSLGGFKEKYTTPDMELILRAQNQGYRIHFHPECRVLHSPVRGGLPSVLAHVRSYSKITIQLRNQYRDLIHTPFFLRSPRWLMIFTPLIAAGKTIEIYFGDLWMLRFIHTAPLVFLLKFNWCIGAYQGLKAMEQKSSQSTQIH